MQENQVKFGRKKSVKSLTLDNNTFNGMFETSSNGQFANNFISMPGTDSNEATNNQVGSHQTVFNQHADYPSNLLSIQNFNFQSDDPTTVNTNSINTLTFPRTPGFLGHQDFGIMLDPGTVHFNTPQWGGMQPNIDLISNERNMLLGYASSNMMMSQPHTTNVNDPFASQYLTFNNHSLPNQAHSHNFTNPNDFMTPQFMPTIQMNYSPSLQAFNNRFWSLPNSGNLNLINPGNMEQIDFPQLNSRPLETEEKDNKSSNQQITLELSKGLSKHQSIRAYSHSSQNNSPGNIINESRDDQPTRVIRTRRKRTSKYQASSLSTILSNADLSADKNDILEANPINGTNIENRINDKFSRKNSVVELVATRLRTTSSEIFKDISKLVAPNNVLTTVKTVQTASVALPHKNEGELVLPEFFFKKPSIASNTVSVLNISKLSTAKETLPLERNVDETVATNKAKSDDLAILAEELKSIPSEKSSKITSNSRKVAVAPRKLGNRTISPAIFPRQVKDDVAAFQLSSKSNYQLIMEGGNAAAGLNYNPDFEQLVKRKRLHHQASEQKRRAVLATRFKELARILPQSSTPINQKSTNGKKLKDTTDTDNNDLDEDDKNSNLSQSKILAGALDLYNQYENMLKLQDQLLHLLKIKFQLDDSIQLENLDLTVNELPNSTNDNLSERELSTINSADNNN